jgi:predicted nicotinamide N-methyase
MSRWVASPDMVRRLSGRDVLELGAGCGAPSLAAAVHGAPRSVVVTDLNPDTIDNARHNIGLNLLRGGRGDGEGDDGTKKTSVTAAPVDWADESTYPVSLIGGKFDYVICSDCIYQRDIAHLLRKVVAALLDPNGGTFLYVAPDGGRDGLDEFIAGMKSDGGFECVSEAIAPDRYRENPLKSGDEEDFFLHFHELASKVYILYEFRRC